MEIATGLQERPRSPEQICRLGGILEGGIIVRVDGGEAVILSRQGAVLSRFENACAHRRTVARHSACCPFAVAGTGNNRVLLWEWAA
jgi:hypothetical protein